MTALEFTTTSNGALANNGDPEEAEEQGLLVKTWEKTSPTRVCQLLYSVTRVYSFSIARVLTVSALV